MFLGWIIPVTTATLLLYVPNSPVSKSTSSFKASFCELKIGRVRADVRPEGDAPVPHVSAQP
jgi:hypothetical protein